MENSQTKINRLHETLNHALKQEILFCYLPKKYLVCYEDHELYVLWSKSNTARFAEF
jgi:hypothetical protein